MPPRVVPGVNAFTALASDDDDIADDDFSAPNSSSATPDSSPDSLLSQLQRRLPSPVTIPSLCESVQSLLRLNRQRASQWCSGFEAYDNIDPDSYETIFGDRIRCFDRLNDPPLLEFIDLQLADHAGEIIFHDFVLQTAKALASPGKPTGHGGLFLLSRLLLKTPAALQGIACSPDSVAPVLSWLLRFLLAEAPSALSSRFVIQLFHKILVNANPEFAPLSVAASHLIRLAIRDTIAVPASQYVFLLEVSRRSGSNRDRHVSAVIKPLLEKLVITISDIENYPRELISHYANPSAFVVEIFVTQSIQSPEFLKGWLACNAQRPDLSQPYVSAVTGKLPRELLEKFPIEQWEANEEDEQQLVAKERKLSASSLRFLLLLILGGGVAMLRWDF
jgi:hypothetical protein